MDPNYLVFFAVIGGSAVGYKSGFPAGALVGGLIVGLIIKAVMHMGLDEKIEWLSWISQALVAYVLVRGSDFSSIAELPKYFPAAMAYSFSLLAFTLGLSLQQSPPHTFQIPTRSSRLPISHCTSRFRSQR